MVKKVTNSEYYIASALCFQTKAFDGSIMTEENTMVWFCYSEGYQQCTTSKKQAHHFKCIEKIKDKVKTFDGMPWYYRLKPETLRIFKITESITIEYNEEEIPV
jgi:hypothetical protein